MDHRHSNRTGTGVVAAETEMKTRDSGDCGGRSRKTNCSKIVCGPVVVWHVWKGGGQHGAAAGGATAVPWGKRNCWSSYDDLIATPICQEVG